MADKKLSIEVETRLSGQGFQEGERQAQQLNRELGQLERTIQEITTELRQVQGELREATGRFRELDNPIDEAGQSLERATDQIRFADDDLRDMVESTRLSAKEWAEWGKPFKDFLSMINTGRFHTQEMVKWLSGATSETRNYRQENALAKEDIHDLSDSLRTLQAAVRELTSHMDRSQNGVDALGNEFAEGGDRAYYMVQALMDSTFAINRTETAASGLTTELNQVENATSQLAAEMNQAETKVNQLQTELNQLAANANQADNGLNRVQMGANALAQTMGGLLQEAIEEVARAVIEFVQESVQAFENFDMGIREIYTMLPGLSSEAKEQLSADAQALSIELGRLPEEVLPAIYQALSSGVPEENVIETVRTASEAARAGVAELDDTLTLGLAIMNAHVSGVNDLGDVYDVLFHTVKEGVVTMPELTQVMSQVTSIAGEAGVSLQDISAAMITMTKQGDSASEAAELLAIMLTQLSTSGTTLATVFEQAAGQSFRQFIAEGGTLAEAMELLQQHANNTGQALGDILGGGSPFFRDTQAARGALELTGAHLGDLKAAAEGVAQATGSMSQAAAEFEGSQGLARQEAEATTAVFKAQLGEALTPLTRGFYEAKQGASLLGSTYLTTIAAYQDGKISLKDTVLLLDGIGRGSVTAEQAQKKLAEATNEYAAAQQAAATEKSLIDNLARTSESAEEFRTKLAAIAPEFAAQKEAATAYWESIHGQHEQAMIAADERAEAMNAYGLQLLAVGEQEAVFSEGVKNGVMLRRDLVLQETQTIADRNLLITEGNETAALSYEMLAERMSLSIGREMAALQESQIAFGQQALAALDATDKQINWTDELFRAAATEGIAAEQLALLAAATGEYTNEQIAAMLRTAAMKQAVEAMAGQIANGTLTVDEAIDSLAAFKAQLENPKVAILDYSDFQEAEKAAKDAKGAFESAAGEYHATFTTDHVDNYYENRGDNAGGGYRYQGGRVNKNSAYLVGDDHGRPTPYSEIFVPDSPGNIIGVEDTRALLQNQGEPTETFGYSSYGMVQGQGQTTYIDQSKLVLNNNSREAAALSMALVAERKRARLDAWMGV